MAKCNCTVGQLRHYITIESRTLTSDQQGGSTEAWATFANAWAKIEPMSPKQIWYSEQLQHRVTHKFTIRYIANFDSDMRISFDSRTFHVQGFKDPDELKQWLEISVEEGAPA